MLLIITNKSDITTDYLILKLQERNIPFLRLNTEDYLKKYQINISVENTNIRSLIEFEKGSIFDIKNFTGVYFHQPIKPDLKYEVVESGLKFAERESLETLRSLWRIIDKELWVNHPKCLWAANNKIEQLKVASNLGFDIPPTLVSTIPEQITNFYNNYNGEIIGKAVKHGFFKYENKVNIANTQKIENNFIKEISNYAKVPMIFQKLIKKKYDIRVTLIKNEVFSTAIHSQDHEETKTDWRVWDIIDDIDLKHSTYQLPGALSQKCIDLTKYFNLKYSAIDLVQTPDNRYYFLELNPNGQWAWIEKMVGYPIRNSLIKCLGY